ncbi:hypothetical protein F503_07299 [Ophiostoma piceae UAMH 11346]|uniref:F-box domain-containing protein n=1 Tax=Ophiostoma piceae (strain UAMH 11346) TaxID=1262450 RepID=S3CS99_OPHP1|nr:hypothetical protein F503_07299 [Ophiostoma piceae UAMH 11346]
MALRLGLESLPMELFLAIVTNLSIIDQLSLGQCKRDYHYIIERDIFRLEAMRDFAMFHAIKNLNIHIIKRLLAQYNASPTVMFLISKPYGLPQGFIATNAGIFVLARFRKMYDIFPEQDSSETLIGIAEMTLHALAKLDTAKMDAEQRKTYVEMWALFLDHGARLNIITCSQSLANMTAYLNHVCLPTKEDKQEPYLEYREQAAKFGRRKARELFRRIMSKPSWNPELADVKAKLIRIYYETLRGIAVADLNIGPSSVFQQIPRHIRSVHDAVVIEAIMDGEEKLDRAHPTQSDASLPLAWRSIPLVDRPVKRGQRGELVSPLSAAILNDNHVVFDLLLRRGANINGVDLGLKRHGPKKYALHIPIFAAAWMAARDYTNGFRWLASCIANGADPNHLYLGRLNGDFFIETGIDTSGHQGFFHWISPLDVYLATIPKRKLCRLLPTSDNSNTVDAKNEPELKKIEQLVNKGFRMDAGVYQPISFLLAPQNSNGRNPMAIAHVCGRARNHSGHLCNWGGFHRCRSPSAAEIIIDRVGFATPKTSVASELVRCLMDTHGSGRGCFSRIMFRYERDLHRLEYREDSEADRCLPMAKALFGSMYSPGWVGRDYGNELGLYIAYRMLHNRYGSISAHLATIDRFKGAATAQNGEVGAVFYLPMVAGPPPIDFNPLYVPLNLAYDDYRLRVCGRAPNRFNAHPVEGWTVLHEVCRLWNMATKDWSVRSCREVWDAYRDQASGTLKLLQYLIENGVNVYVVDANGDTPMDVLIKDDGHSLSEEVSATLRGMANFMIATWSCLNIGRGPMRVRHIDPLRSNQMVDQDSH